MFKVYRYFASKPWTLLPTDYYMKCRRADWGPGLRFFWRQATTSELQCSAERRRRNGTEAPSSNSLLLWTRRIESHFGHSRSRSWWKRLAFTFYFSKWQLTEYFILSFLQRQFIYWYYGRLFYNSNGLNFYQSVHRQLLYRKCRSWWVVAGEICIVTFHSCLF